MTDFDATRALFDLPEGVIYLDGNSLGPLPKSVPARLEAVQREEWGAMLIGGWNKADWIGMPKRLGNRIAPLIGAAEDTVIVGDTLSIRVFQALDAALKLRPDRRVILSDSGNFPSDLYMAEGLAGLTQKHELRVVPPDALLDALTPEIAALMVTEVDYRTGRRHDMPRLTARAHEVGALAIWDLAHSAGAFPVDVTGGAADFAVGCTYKYLNAGPGAPAFLYAAPSVTEAARPALAGWMGHATPFAFEPGYRPAPGIDRFRVGTPPVLQMAALDAALDVWTGVDLADIRARSLDLGDLFIAEIEARCPELTLVTPRAHDARGSQVSFRHAQGYAIMQALIARGVIGDFRDPDILRFGITPLYIGEREIMCAVDALEAVLRGKEYERTEYQTRAAVT